MYGRLRAEFAQQRVRAGITIGAHALVESVLRVLMLCSSSSTVAGSIIDGSSLGTRRDQHTACRLRTYMMYVEPHQTMVKHQTDTRSIRLAIRVAFP